MSGGPSKNPVKSIAFLVFFRPPAMSEGYISSNERLVIIHHNRVPARALVHTFLWFPRVRNSPSSRAMLSPLPWALCSPNTYRRPSTIGLNWRIRSLRYGSAQPRRGSRWLLRGWTGVCGINEDLLALTVHSMVKYRRISGICSAHFTIRLVLRRNRGFLPNVVECPFRWDPSTYNRG